MTILDTLAACARERTKLNKQQLTMEEITKLALAMNANTGFPFEKALAKPGMSFICEVKKASPSKGLIAPDFPYMQIAREYEEAGAAAISEGDRSGSEYSGSPQGFYSGSLHDL